MLFYYWLFIKSYDNLLCFEKSFERGKVESFGKIALISKPCIVDY